MKFNIDEQKRILNYLKNPAGTGLWILDVRWKKGKGFTEFLSELLESDLPNRKRKSSDYRAVRFLELLENPAYLLLIFSRTSTHVKNGAKDDQIRSYFDSVSEDIVGEYGQRIYKKYNELFHYFDENIASAYFSVNNNSDLSSLKTGSFLITSPKENYYRFMAFNEETLLCINRFFVELEKTDSCQPYTVYSPEEELLSPYAKILESYIGNIEMSSSIKSHFRKMIEDFYIDNYTGCVSAAGLVAEECLTQVYETIARQSAPKNLMLGQVVSQIGDAVQQILRPQKKDKAITHKDLIQKIKKLSDNKDVSKALISTEKLLAEYIDSQINKLKEEINDPIKNSSDYDLYPKIIRYALEDVILYRNAASHKSTYPIDSLKALKSIYGSLGLVLWWNEQRLRVSASKTQKEIVQDFIKSAGSYS